MWLYALYLGTPTKINNMHNTMLLDNQTPDDTVQALLCTCAVDPFITNYKYRFIMKNIYIIPCALLILFACVTISRPADTDDTITGKGEALIINNDIPSAKKQALQEAFRNLVRKGVGSYIKGKTQLRNAQVITSNIIEESEGYVSQYKIVSEKQKDNIYTVVIQGKVSKEKIDQAFSSRLSRFVEKNMIGPGAVQVQIRISSTQEHFSVGIFSPINDPTIDMDTIKIRLPETGWIKPNIMNNGVMNNLNYYSDKSLLGDMAVILEQKKIDVRFINPANDKLETRPMFFDKFLMLNVHENGKTLFSTERAWVTFKAFGNDKLEELIEYLKSKIKK